MSDELPVRPFRAPLRRSKRIPSRVVTIGLLFVGAIVVAFAATRIGPRSVTGIGNPGPTASPAAVSVLDAHGLRAAIEAERAGGLAPRDVIAGVTIDPSPRTPPRDRECVPVGQCAVIGTLDGFDPTLGVVTLRATQLTVPPPTDAAALQAPVALRLSGSGPIEFLGHVRLGPAGRAFDVPAALALTETAADGEVIAATGWLVGVEGFSCGPVPPPGPSVPAPFACPVVPAFLTATPVRPVAHIGNSFTLHAPSGALHLQTGAYQEVAPQPSFDGANDVPRLGTYLLRMVAIDQPNCRRCRGWLAVGRLDARAMAASPAPSGYQPLVRSTDELELALAKDRAALVGQVVFVDGRIVPGTASGCSEPGPCSLGVLAGTSEQVVATPFVVSQLIPGDEVPTINVLALLVRPSGLEYLGFGAVPLPLSQLADPLVTNGLPLQVHPVDAWLVGEGPLPCPSLANGPPGDTPFDQCGGSWLTTSAQQPVQRNGGGLSIVPPRGAIRVQPFAYDEFAPSPAPEPDGVGFVPREGTYLVRMITWTPPGGRAETGWQIVARQAP